MKGNLFSLSPMKIQINFNPVGIWGFLLTLAVAMSSSVAFSEGTAGGRGGAFLQMHSTSLSAFDPQMQGTPLVVGGEGFAPLGKGYRIGGGGGGGFLWNASNNSQFALGFGGLIGEYDANNWLNFRILLGGGGYAVSKTVSDTNTLTTEEKLGSGGFLLVFPSVGADITLSGSSKLGFRLGYFLPNVAHLQSMTLGVHLAFGKM